jgi:putative peptidoglycan lipid II flippase
MTEASISLTSTPPPASRSRAGTVAGGILTSRLVGFVRERAFAHYLGGGAFADALTSAFRGPNVLQVLLGEQALSAAFIPIYSRMLEEGREEEAGRFAGAIFGLLLAAAAALSLAGILLARPLVALFAGGYLQDAAKVAAGELVVDRFELTVAAVHWIFPMTGLLVLSAWALGILNSHRKFFLPYFAPVLWNAAILGTLIYGASTLGALPWAPWQGTEVPGGELGSLVLAACVGGLLGGGLQFLVQLPSAWRALRGLRPSFSLKVPGVREALAAFGPAVAGRGVVQISLYLDQLLATLLIAGAPSAIQRGAFLYALPISLFAMSVAAAELPELSRLSAAGTVGILPRAVASIRQILFLIMPTLVGYLAFGFLLVGAVYRSGAFGPEAHVQVTVVLAAYTLGLPASTTSRMMQNLFFALGDTRMPARVAAIRMAVSASLGATLMVFLDRLPVKWLLGGAGSGEALFLGAVGLALGSAVGSWVEVALLTRALRRRLEPWRLPVTTALRWGAFAVMAALPAAGLWWLLDAWMPGSPWLLQAAAVVGLFAGLYLAVARWQKEPELERWLGALKGRRARRGGGGSAGMGE